MIDPNLILSKEILQEDSLGINYLIKTKNNQQIYVRILDKLINPRGCQLELEIYNKLKNKGPFLKIIKNFHFLEIVFQKLV